MNSPYIKTYTLQEVAKQICVPVGTIKRWEKALDELLIVPRTKQGARYYTEVELTFLEKVKDLRERNSMNQIKTILLQQSNLKQDQFNEEFLPLLQFVRRIMKLSHPLKMWS
ncbi:MerR family transcriptional regulator [Bacillus sp. T3]|uniref:MerR family transcriptional regulator n=1 Tax=Bacillus sp. T3 TaxID=467262 RepID=UPI002981DE7F|nr:MerR family transcriptional regulator [Bacillus sp. T3]